ncbi:hypothetical protein diail_6952 [Diaporthe ilicicola]|nr:hypothetical protein diail_6952 [Diaporthe ilicicola]
MPRAWSKDEERVFWRQIAWKGPPGTYPDVKRAKKGLEGVEKNWGTLVPLMEKLICQESGQETLPRDYTGISLSEHYYANFTLQKYSPHAKPFVDEYKKWVAGRLWLQKHGGNTSDPSADDNDSSHSDDLSDSDDCSDSDESVLEDAMPPPVPNPQAPAIQSQATEHMQCAPVYTNNNHASAANYSSLGAPAIQSQATEHMQCSPVYTNNNHASAANYSSLGAPTLLKPMASQSQPTAMSAIMPPAFSGQMLAPGGHVHHPNNYINGSVGHGSISGIQPGTYGGHSQPTAMSAIIPPAFSGQIFAPGGHIHHPNNYINGSVGHGSISGIQPGTYGGHSQPTAMSAIIPPAFSGQIFAPGGHIHHPNNYIDGSVGHRSVSGGQPNTYGGHNGLYNWNAGFYDPNRVQVSQTFSIHDGGINDGTNGGIHGAMNGAMNGGYDGGYNDGVNDGVNDVVNGRMNDGS